VTEVSDNNPAPEATLFDVDEYRAADIAHRHAVDHDLPDAASATERLLRGALPIATSHRWKPLRCGLVNLYLFDNEVFPFAGGRLLLRGDNGAGKSRVLALTLPLLLDGRLHPSRVEPDRDSNRQIAWNLLLDEHQDRTGYTWIEFGCVDDNGETQCITLGVGLRAVRGRGITDHWMFVSNQRIGSTLSLITPEKRVASKRILQESFGESGQIYESSTEYRRAVDERLFRLGDRYEALLDLLLQLRQPQLAKKLDLAGLESALVEAMPPISSTLLSDAADAFRSLDQERETLHGLQQGRLTVQDFLRPYRRHLRHGIRRAANRLRACHSRFEQARKTLREAEQAKSELKDHSARIAKQREETLQKQKTTTVALQTLQAAPAMKQADRLNGARQLHDAAVNALNQARAASQRVTSEVNEASLDRDRCRQEVQDRLDRAEQLREQAETTAEPAALKRLHAEQFRRFLKTAAPTSKTDDSTWELRDDLQGLIAETSQTLSRQVDHWLRTGGHLRDLHGQTVDATDTLRSSVRRLDDAQDRLQAAADDLIDADEHLQQTTETLWNNIASWLSAGQSLTVTLEDTDALKDRWIDWAGTLQGTSPVFVEIDQAMRRVQAAIATERSGLHQAGGELQQQRNALSEELQQLSDGKPACPLPSRMRSADARNERAGAALWELIEFVPAVSQGERAGWEAALEASGLLDAWLSSDGTLQHAESYDTVLIATAQPAEIADARLSHVLVPSSDCREKGFEPTVVGNLLDRIGAGKDSHSVWVDHEGHWQNGPLMGHWMKPIPQYIGQDVRNEWNRRHTSVLSVQLSAIEEQISEIQLQLDQLTSREHQIDAHRRELPDDGPIRSAVARHVEVERQQQQAHRHVQEATTDERLKRHQRDERIATRNTAALDVGLNDWADQPEALLQHVTTYRDRLAACIDAWKIAATAGERFRRTEDLHERRQTEQQQQTVHLRIVEQDEQSRRAALDELQKTVGVDTQEIIQRIASKEMELATLETNLESITDELRESERNVVRLETQLETLSSRVDDADRLRRQAADAITELADMTLLPTADQQLSDVLQAPGSLTATVELARRIEQLSWRVPDVEDEESWKRSQRQIYDALEPLKGRLTSFGMNAEPEFLGEHVCRVQIRHQAELVTPDMLVKQLDSEVDEHERVLSESERTILEKHLLGEVAGELHERMQQARELVDSMNHEVSGRPMKTGMQMRFRWEADTEGPAGLATASRILATGPATWSDGDRRTLGEFLHEQITFSREQEDAGSRLEQLTTVLDYRRWHRLRIDRRASQDQEWKLLTRKTYGSGSGGEKAIALTLPQVAAAAAYYRTADPRAPRLILMDEVFAGISGNNRAACMALLAAFDLDVVMTSESEWGCYTTVPELAICQLTRVPELAAIDNTVFVWNGSERVTADQP